MEKLGRLSGGCDCSRGTKGGEDGQKKTLKRDIEATPGRAAARQRNCSERAVTEGC